MHSTRIADESPANSIDIHPEIGATLSITLDLNQLAESIIEKNKSAKKREALVHAVINYFQFVLQKSKGNEIIMNLEQSYDQVGLRDMCMYETIKIEGILYGVWIFGHGTFENKGYGSYLNWGVWGVFDRDEGSGKVSFPKRY
ncbi:hypothetical protein AKO1_008524 [Acrasis kona]|uniref:Uncharacterized protein n=1 Tax=Acrasis kona TaxID=1008807 RepID=A0AAW2YQ92_9EUKA